MNNHEVAARRGMHLFNEACALAQKVTNLGVYIVQWFIRQSSNYSLVIEFFVLLALLTTILGSSWILCALNDACFQANGGMF